MPGTDATLVVRHPRLAMLGLDALAAPVTLVAGREPWSH
jgi:hypothetical protein